MKHGVASQFSTKQISPSKSIIFYDSECGFCEFWVSLIVNDDYEEAFLFAPLKYIHNFINLHSTEQPPNNTLILLIENQIFIRSAAVFEIALRLRPFRWRILSFFRFVPRPLTDFVYRIIAKIRRYIPVKTFCKNLTETQKKRFINSL